MSNKDKKRNAKKNNGSIDKDGYEKSLRELQIELVKAQRCVIAKQQKVLIVIEGRDAAGKDGTIKRLTEHMSPRETRIVALPKPSDRDRTSWYFQRYVPHLPAGEEFVIFNRSWYNRAGVEPVMGFCTDAEYEEFMNSVIPFEHMLVNSGIKLIKYYLDIDKDEQIKRLQERRDDPLKQWKISPIDKLATKCWKKYSAARNEMLMRTNNSITPWFVVRADDKPAARLNLIRHILSQLDYPGADKKLVQPDNSIVFQFDPVYLSNGYIAK